MSSGPQSQQSKTDQEANEIWSHPGDVSGAGLASLKQVESDQEDADASGLASGSGLPSENVEPHQGLDPRWKDASSESQQVGLLFYPFSTS